MFIKTTALVIAMAAALGMGGELDNIPNKLPEPKPLIQPVPDHTDELIAAQNAQARAKEREMLKQYQRPDYNAMRGVVLEPIDGE